jgi:hypothetical protein
MDPKVWNFYFYCFYNTLNYALFCIFPFLYNTGSKKFGTNERFYHSGSKREGVSLYCEFSYNFYHYSVFKANEIAARAEEDHFIEKNNYLEAEKEKIRKEYERKQSQISVKRRMFEI